MTLPTLATYRDLPGYRETGGYARRSWMESYAIDCPNCDGVTRCICSDDQFSLSREIAVLIKGGANG